MKTPEEWAKWLAVFLTAHTPSLNKATEVVLAAQDEAHKIGYNEALQDAVKQIWIEMHYDDGEPVCEHDEGKFCEMYGCSSFRAVQARIEALNK